MDKKQVFPIFLVDELKHPTKPQLFDGDGLHL